MQNVALTVISDDPQDCAGGQCPTIYRTESGRILIKGWRVTNDIRASAQLSINEEMVEIPASLLTKLKT